MEKMSELISELRENCQTLQSELEQRSNQSCHVAVQVNLSENNNNVNHRSSSGFSKRPLTSESARKAASVYSRSSSANRSAGSTSSSSTRLSNNINNKVNNNKGQARIAKPVARSLNSLVNKESPKKSRIPQPSPSRIPQPKLTNGHTYPNRALKANQSPPPAPPPSQLPMNSDHSSSPSVNSHTPSSCQHTPSKLMERSPTPPLSPVNPTSQPTSYINDDSFFDQPSILGTRPSSLLKIKL